MKNSLQNFEPILIGIIIHPAVFIFIISDPSKMWSECIGRNFGLIPASFQIHKEDNTQLRIYETYLLLST